MNERSAFETHSSFPLTDLSMVQPRSLSVRPGLLDLSTETFGNCWKLLHYRMLFLMPNQLCQRWRQQRQADQMYRTSFAIK